MNASLFGPTHPYGHHQLGTEESIQKTTKADLERFYGSAFGPKNAALILVGDLTEAEARKLATDAFGAWQGDAVAAPVPPQGTTLASRVVIVDKPSNQTTLLAGQMGVKRSDPDYEKLDVMNSVLGGLFSSRINMNLREDKGYSYGAFSFVGQNRGVGPLMAGAAVRADVTGASIQEILNEVTKIKESGVTAEELTMSKESITRSLPANFETTSSTAGTIAQIYMYDLPVDYYQTLPSRLAAIQPADVLAVAKKHLVPERMVIVAVGDRSVIEPQITKLNLGAIAYRDADGKEMAAAPAAPATPTGPAACGGTRNGAAPLGGAAPFSMPGSARVLAAGGARRPARPRLRRVPRRGSGREGHPAAAREVVLHEEEPSFSGAAHDAEQGFHAGHLFQLLVHEPLEEAAREVVLVADGQIHEIVDLARDRQLPLQGELHRLLVGLELSLRSRHGRDADPRPGVHQIVHEPHGMAPLLHRLLVEMGGELRQVLGAEVGPDRNVLQRRAEFVPDLGVDGGGHTIADQHDVSRWMVRSHVAPERASFEAGISGAGTLLCQDHAPLS
jgi:hypothetical protein